MLERVRLGWIRQMAGGLGRTMLRELQSFQEAGCTTSAQLGLLQGKWWELWGGVGGRDDFLVFRAGGWDSKDGRRTSVEVVVGTGASGTVLA